MKRTAVLAALLLILGASEIHAQTVPALATVVSACGTPPTTYSAGQQKPITQSTGGLQCNSTSTNPGARTVVTLDVKTVTTGGTAVTAIAAGHRTAGGFLLNPVGATIALCINEIGAASGTTSSGDTTCIQPGQSYTVAPASTAVSVVSSDSAHPFSGEGLN